MCQNVLHSCCKFCWALMRRISDHPVYVYTGFMLLYLFIFLLKCIPRVCSRVWSAISICFSKCPVFFNPSFRKKKIKKKVHNFVYMFLVKAQQGFCVTLPLKFCFCPLILLTLSFRGTNRKTRLICDYWLCTAMGGMRIESASLLRGEINLVISSILLPMSLGCFYNCRAEREECWKSESNSFPPAYFCKLGEIDVF